jgi:hypothetical protein
MRQDQRPADTKHAHLKAEVMTSAFGVCVVLMQQPSDPKKLALMSRWFLLWRVLSTQQPSGPQKVLPYSTSASQI